MIVNYDEMYAEYKKNIETNLRGFSGGPHPFETWVPYDGNQAKSMDELVDLAKEDGHEVVNVYSERGGISYKSLRAKAAEDRLNQYLNQNRITVVGLKRSILTIDYEDLPGEPPIHLSLMKFEERLNKELNEKFDIQTTTVEDKNKRKHRK